MRMAPREGTYGRMVVLWQRRLDDVVAADDELLQAYVAEPPTESQGHRASSRTERCTRRTPRARRTHTAAGARAAAARR